MNWNLIPPHQHETLKHIATTLTPRQRAVWHLHMAGWGYKRIGLLLDISPSTARDHLNAAEQRIRQHPDYPRHQ